MKKNNRLSCILIIASLVGLFGMVDPTKPPNYVSIDISNTQTMQLYGIVSHNNRRVAIIGQKIVYPGDILGNGSRVVAINRESVAIINTDNHNEILYLPSSVRKDERHHDENKN